jgi:flavin reductase (DIM6/NTAB) family NADH-FMN oxidoreductase RutF
LTEDVKKAIGRIPSGVYVLTAQHQGQATAMLASWVQQAAFDPPAISIAISPERPAWKLITDSGRFALSILGEGDTAFMKKYARGIEPGRDPFDGVQTAATPSGIPILADALAWLDCRVIQTVKFDADHELFIGEVTAGQMLRDGSAFTHQRGNGYHY